MNKKAYTTPQTKLFVMSARHQLLAGSVGLGGTYNSSVNGDVRAPEFDFDFDDEYQLDGFSQYISSSFQQNSVHFMCGSARDGAAARVFERFSSIMNNNKVENTRVCRNFAAEQCN